MNNNKLLKLCKRLVKELTKQYDSRTGMYDTKRRDLEMMLINFIKEVENEGDKE